MLSPVLCILPQETMSQIETGRQRDPKESWLEESHRSFYTYRGVDTEKFLHKANPCKLQHSLPFLNRFLRWWTQKTLRCFHLFFAFFHKKECCRLKLDDSVTRKEAGGRSRREAFTHTEAFTQRSLYTKHTEAVTQRRVYTEGFLHTDAFAHRSV